MIEILNILIPSIRNNLIYLPTCGANKIFTLALKKLNSATQNTIS